MKKYYYEGLTFKLWGVSRIPGPRVPRSRISGSWSQFYTMPHKTANQWTTNHHKLPAVIYCVKGYFFIWFVAVILRKKLKQSLNITCGGKQISIISWQMIRHHGTHVTHQASPQYQIMMGWNKILMAIIL